MKTLELKIWKLFNLAVRITGYCFILLSIVFLLCSLILFVVDSPYKDSLSFVSIGAILAVIILIGGLFMVKMKSYYPNHIEEYMKGQ